MKCNEHWTDLVCGVEDTQYDVPVDELKARFTAAAALEAQSAHKT